MPLTNSDLLAIYRESTSTAHKLTIDELKSFVGDGFEVPSDVTPPTGASPGDLWFNETDGRLYYYYDDGSTEQWVDASPAGSGGSDEGASVNVSETPPLNPSEGDLWWDSSTDSGQLYIYYVDANSSQWVETSPSSGGGGGGGVTQDLQSVTDEGNTTTNGATFGGGKIELAANGNVTTVGRFQADRTVASDGTFRSALNGVVKHITYADGTTYIGSDGDVQTSRKITLVSDGSASFSDGDLSITSSGRLNSTEVNTYGTAGFIANGTNNTSLDYAWRGVNPSGTNTSTIDYDGSAEFTGPVKIGGTADANKISEYEEGTWSPVLGFDAATTYNIQWGKYVKVGTFVQCWGGLRPTNIGPGNPRTIQGLPFASSGVSGTDQGGGSIVWCDGAAVDFIAAFISVNPGSINCSVNVKTGASQTLQNGSIDFWTNNQRANFYFCYFTDS